MRKLPAIIFIMGVVLICSFLTSVFYVVGSADQNRLCHSLVVWATVCFAMHFAIGRQNKKQRPAAEINLVPTGI